VLLEADRLIEDQEAHQIIADGHVEARYGKRTLRADRLIYDTEKKTIRAQGKVEITDGTGSVRFAEEAEVDESLNVGVATNFAVRLPGNGTAAASSAVLRPDGVRQLNRAIYTACPVCATDGNSGTTWTLKARTITDNPNSKMMSYRDVVLQIHGVPVFYLPYLTHPDPSEQRKSGLLMPDAGSNSAFGGYYAQPIYWAISPYQDLTVTPRFMTKVSPLGLYKYRKNFYSGSLQFDGSVTNEQDFDSRGNTFGERKLRESLFGAGAFQINDYWRWGFNVAQVSDDLYLKRYQINDDPELRAPYTTDLARLFSQLFVTGQGPNTYSNVALITAQGLREGDTDANLPKILPKGEVNWTTRDPLVGGQARLQASTVNLVGVGGVDSARASAGGEWALERAIGPGLVVNPYLQARTDYYWINNFNGIENQSFARSVGLAGVELRYPLISATKSASFIVEPIVAATYATPARNQNRIPNEDSQAFELDETNLFRPNVTPNYDLWEPGARVAVGVRASAITNLGTASATFGQRFKEEDDTAFSSTSNIAKQRSDYVASVSADLGPHFGGDVRLRLDNASLDVVRLDAGLRASLWKVSAYTRYFDVNQGLRGSDPSQELATGLNVQLSKSWSMTYGLRRDLDSDINLSQDASVTYRNDCLFLQVMYTQNETVDRVLGPREGIQFRLGLSTLGVFGNR
jgi:LPS-assembly protein